MTTWLKEMWARLRSTVQRDRVDREMEEEFRFHVDMAAQRNLRRGLRGPEARREAVRNFGGMDRHLEASRDEQRGRILESIGADIRQAVRTLRRAPEFAFATIVTLALGIGANTAIFSVVSGVLLAPLPYPAQDRLAFVGWDWGNGNWIGALSQNQFFHFREHSSVLEGVTTWRTFDAEFGEGQSARIVDGMRVSDDFFGVLAVEPVLGRSFSAEERAPGGPEVAVVSDGFWRTVMGSDPDALGRTMRFGDVAYTVIGVLPQDFRFTPTSSNPDVIVPLRMRWTPGADGGQNFSVLARLRTNVSLDRAAGELAEVSRAYRETYPELVRGREAQGARLLKYQDIFVGGMQSTLWVMLAAVAFVLLIACANAANLMLARATGRDREVAVRVAIGAGRQRILRQMLTEAVVLAFIAGCVGLVIGVVGVDAVLALAPGDIPRREEIGLDVRVLAFTFAIALFTGLVYGLAGALPGIRSGLADVLRKAGRGNTAGRTRVRETLIVLETAVALVLLAGAGLLVHSFRNLRTLDPGFDASNVIAVRFGRLPVAFDTVELLMRWEHTLAERIGQVPGVIATAAASNYPLERGLNLPIAVEGRPDAAEGAVEWRAISPDYFETLRIPVLRGRTFQETDDAGGARVAIVNEAYAAHYWPAGNAIGQRIEIMKWRGEWMIPSAAGATEIVGIVADVNEIELQVAPRRTVYVPRAQAPRQVLGPPAFMVRVTGNSSLVPAIADAVRDADLRVLPPTFETLSTIVDADLADERFRVVILSAFALTALLLTAVGVFGVIAHSVTQQTREIGIRMALGAHARSVELRLVRRAMLLVAAGAAMGALVATALTRFIASMLYDVAATDVTTFAIVATLLGAVALTAAWLPARRATRIAPTEALRID
jgi:predicted permease